VRAKVRMCEARCVGPPTSSRDVAAVILTYNPGPAFGRVLDAVRNQSEPPALVVVVDNASTDGTADRLQLEVGVEVVALDTNVGVGAGHNLGWATARQRCTELRAIWAVEHDCVPERDCLARLIAVGLDQLAAGVRLAAIAPIQTAPGETFERTPRPPWSTPNLTFNGALVHLDALDAVGPLREDFFIGHEDKDLSYRLRRAGFDIIRIREAQVEHANARRPTRPSVIRSYYSRRNEAYLAVHVRGDRWARAWVVYRAVGGVVRAVAREDRKWARARARARAALDGIRGDLGRKAYPYLQPEQ
jgi:rhamnosyltransferase